MGPNNILEVFQSTILDALVCGWNPRRMENKQVGPGDWKTRFQVGRYYIDLLWNLAPQDPPRNPSIIYYGQGISVYSGNYYRVYNVSECLGSALQLALKPGCAGQQSGRVRSIKPCFSIRNNWVIWPAFYAIVACCHAHSHLQLPKLIVCHAPPNSGQSIPSPFVAWYFIYQISFLVIRATLPTLVVRALGCRRDDGGVAWAAGSATLPRPPHYPKLQLANTTTPPN